MLPARERFSDSHEGRCAGPQFARWQTHREAALGFDADDIDRALATYAAIIFPFSAASVGALRLRTPSNRPRRSSFRSRRRWRRERC